MSSISSLSDLMRKFLLFSKIITKGINMDQSTNTGQSDKEWLTTLLLCLFLGGLGVPVLRESQAAAHVVNLWWIGNMVDH